MCIYIWQHTVSNHKIFDTSILVQSEKTISPNFDLNFWKWKLFDLLDAPVLRLCMDDAPVPYATTMEKAVVKRGEDLVQGVFDLCTKKW